MLAKLNKSKAKLNKSKAKLNKSIKKIKLIKPNSLGLLANYVYELDNFIPSVAFANFKKKIEEKDKKFLSMYPGKNDILLRLFRKNTLPIDKVYTFFKKGASFFIRKGERNKASNLLITSFKAFLSKSFKTSKPIHRLKNKYKNNKLLWFKFLRAFHGARPLISTITRFFKKRLKRLPVPTSGKKQLNLLWSFFARPLRHSQQDTKNTLRNEFKLLIKKSPKSIILQCNVQLYKILDSLRSSIRIGKLPYAAYGRTNHEELERLFGARKFPSAKIFWRNFNYAKRIRNFNILRLRLMKRKATKSTPKIHLKRLRELNYLKYFIYTTKYGSCHFRRLYKLYNSVN